MAEYDLVVRGGSVADGTGSGTRDADVAVKDGKIAAIGRMNGVAAKEGRTSAGMRQARIKNRSEKRRPTFTYTSHGSWICYDDSDRKSTASNLGETLRKSIVPKEPASAIDAASLARPVSEQGCRPALPHPGSEITLYVSGRAQMNAWRKAAIHPAP